MGGGINAAQAKDDDQLQEKVGRSRQLLPELM
jgi:hypothetical protein